jgi:signal transduction histidine kinase
MKIFTQGIWARRKIIVIFLLGILTPSLFVGYLSWNAFSKRREALRKVIESQLWISGETALKSIERALQEYEDSILNPENFAPLSTLHESRQELEKPSLSLREKIFLLDADFRLVFPQAGSDDIPFVRWEQSMSDSSFASLFQRAEYLEFSQKKYAQAAELYHRCSLSTPVKQLQALALERYGRCLLSIKKYEEASSVYWKLLDEFGQYKNRVGYPYGLVAALQLYDVAQQQQIEIEGDLLKTLIDVLEKLRNGEWQLNNSTYDYFSEEIEKILNKELSAEKYPEFQNSYRTIQEKTSPYLEELEFKKLLEEDVIPILKERIAFSQYSNEPQRGRLPVSSGESHFLFSYSRLGDIPSDQFFYAGFCWDLDYIKNQKLPEVANTLAQTSGIQVRLIDESIQNRISDDSNVIPKDALSITFRQFPFPWRLIVTLAALENLKNTALRENIIYGALLAVIVALMCLGALLIVRDISRESETTRHKSEFVHNISHELKTPLTLIRLYGETLRDKKNLPEENRWEAYEIITRESERLSYMINNVLDFSRIEMGRKEFNLKTGHLAGVIREILESYRYHLEQKGFTIHKEISDDIPPMDFDREAMASVLVNLLSNSMKFSPDKKEVSVRLFRDGDNAVIQVADKGIGISGKEINKIFQPFYRSENKVVSDSRGSGLGLSIVQHIAEAHRAKIEVESEPGKGSVFSVILPIFRPEEDKK